MLGIFNLYVTQSSFVVSHTISLHHIMYTPLSPKMDSKDNFLASSVRCKITVCMPLELCPAGQGPGMRMLSSRRVLKSYKRPCPIFLVRKIFIHFLRPHPLKNSIMGMGRQLCASILTSRKTATRLLNV